MNGMIGGSVIIGTLLIGIISGHPIAFVLGGAGVICTLFFWGPNAIYTVLSAAYGVTDGWVILAAPLFIFMAMILNESKLAKDLYNAIWVWAGSLRGGLAVATIIACTIFAACTGVVAAGVVTMGIISLPRMTARGYNRRLAMGAITAGGSLGELIPPSIIMVIYAVSTNLSVGRLFAGGITTGCILSGLYISYVLGRSYIQKDLCPALPPEEGVSLREKLLAARGVVLPALLILLVLGAIFSGAATPTEAAGMGALGALICTALQRRLDWGLIKRSVMSAIEVNGMIAWIVIGASVFASSFIAIGGGDLVENVLLTLGMGTKWGVFAVTVFILFILGMLINAVPIILICAPLFVPIMINFGFDPVWYALIFMVMMQIGYISPPFGVSMFYLKGVTPKDVTMQEIYLSSLPFIGCQLIGLLIFILLPNTVTWLPNLLFK